MAGPPRARPPWPGPAGDLLGDPAPRQLRGEPTGRPLSFRGDVVAVAKRDLCAGEMLDGEGGYTVYAKLIPAAKSLARNALPIGLAHGVKLKRDIPEGRTVSWDDVDYDASSEAVKVRREMEREFADARAKDLQPAE